MDPQIVVAALVAEFKRAASANESVTTEAVFAAQAALNAIAIRLGLVDEVERSLRIALGFPGFELVRDPEELPR